MVRISREFHAHQGNYTPGGNRPEWIVIHYTANTASARNEATYASRDQHPSSYHFVLDGTGTAYQILDLDDTAWAVGAWAGNTQHIRNDRSVSIEVCNDGGPFTIDEIADLRDLVRWLMAETGIDAEHVVRHWDCHSGPSGRKACPQYYTPAGAGGDTAWQALRAVITREEHEMDVRELLEAPVAYQELSGKQVNRPVWHLLSWGGHYAAFAAAKIPELQAEIASLRKAVDEQTAIIKSMQKNQNMLLKKVG